MLTFLKRKQKPRPEFVLRVHPPALPEESITQEEWNESFKPGKRNENKAYYGETVEEIQQEIDKQELLKKKKIIVEAQEQHNQILRYL